MKAAVSRRKALAILGSGLTAATLAAPSVAGNAANQGAHRRLLLFDPELARRDRATLRATFGAHRPVAIQRELVRQWRDGLAQSVLEARGATALVLWDKVELLRGLGREHRMKVSVSRSGQLGFRVELSA